MLRPVAFAAALALLTASALAAPNTVNNMHNAMSKSSLDANMGQQNNSKQDGTVTLKDVSGGVQVKVTLKNEPKGAKEPAHIHKGTCAKLDPAPYKPLNDIVGGTSTTVVKGISIAMLKKGHYAVNVHQSAANLTHYVSCGDL